MTRRRGCRESSASCIANTPPGSANGSDGRRRRLLPRDKQKCAWLACRDAYSAEPTQACRVSTDAALVGRAQTLRARDGGRAARVPIFSNRAGPSSSLRVCGGVPVEIRDTLGRTRSGSAAHLPGECSFPMRGILSPTLRGFPHREAGRVEWPSSKPPHGHPSGAILLRQLSRGICGLMATRSATVPTRSAAQSRTWSHSRRARRICLAWSEIELGRVAVQALAGRLAYRRAT
jgi:hypothetical protein